MVIATGGRTHGYMGWIQVTRSSPIGSPVGIPPSPHPVKPNIPGSTGGQVERYDLSVSIPHEREQKPAAREVVVFAGGEIEVVQPPLVNDQVVFVECHRIERFDLLAEEPAREGPELLGAGLPLTALALQPIGRVVAVLVVRLGVHLPLLVSVLGLGRLLSYEGEGRVLGGY